MTLKEDASVRETATRILAYRSYSVGEMIEKLIERGFEEDEVRLTAEWLVGLRYLDDETLAADLAKGLFERPYGPHRIRQELRRRLFDEQLIEETLETLPESDTLLDAWIARQARAGDWARQKRKISDALYRRGFDWEDIRAALFRYEMELNDEESQ